MDVIKPGTQAYSYVRFSTDKQLLGDSLRRQIHLAKEYSVKYELNTEPMHDLGISAFKGKNKSRIRTAQFCVV